MRTYMLVDKRGAVWYSPPGASPKECWDKAEDWEQWNQGGACIVGWKEQMQRDGYRAKPVTITETTNG